MFPILYINLPQAVERRVHVEQQLAQVRLPDVQVYRMEAVEPGRLQGLQDDDRLGLTTRLSLTNPSRVRAVARILSHQACWNWMLTHNVDAALILEDTVRFAPTFRDTWFSTVVPLLGAPNRQWDLLLLGFRDVRRAQPVRVDGMVLRTPSFHPRAAFRGSQAYVVTLRGAATLMKHVFPIEVVPTDAFFLVLQQMGRLRLVLLPGSSACDAAAGCMCGAAGILWVLLLSLLLYGFVSQSSLKEQV